MMQSDGQQAARVSALRDLVQWRRLPIADAIARMNEFSWDSDELVELTVVDAAASLDRYLAGEAAAEDVNAWADALEGRDDLALEGAHSELLKEFLFEIANPELAEPLTPTFAQHWKDRLHGA